MSEPVVEGRPDMPVLEPKPAPVEPAMGAAGVFSPRRPGVGLLTAASASPVRPAA